MITIFKDVLRTLGLLQFIRRRIDLVKSYYQVPRGSTVLVHIGKCGGRSVRQTVRRETQKGDVFTVHVRAPVWRRDLKYIIIARDPLSRLVSAFNWQYKVVVQDGTDRAAHKDEYRALVKYSGLSELAERLYRADGTLDKAVRRDMRSISHVRMDISFYLKPLLRRCDPDQISAVLMQETLDDDIYRVFGYKTDKRTNFNPDNLGKKELSDVAAANLKRWLSSDYEMLTKLFCWGKIKASTFALAIAGEPGESVED